MTKKRDRNVVQIEFDKETKEKFKKIADEKGFSMAKWLKAKVNELIKENE